MEGRKDGNTLIHMTLLATAGGPKNKYEENPEPKKRKLQNNAKQEQKIFK